MKIIYKCTCMEHEKTIDVTERPADGDLIMWIELVLAGTIVVDHNTNSKHCKRNIMEYVKIPVDENADGIGMKPKLSS